MRMKTTSKFIDLAPTIIDRLDVPCGKIRLGICEALAFLDRYPDQVPGRTITPEALADAWANAEVVDEYQKGDVMIYMDESVDAVSVFTADNARTANDNQRRLHRAPDPKPTNAELINDLAKEWGRKGQHGSLGQYLTEHGVKAGGDDE